MLGGFQGIQGGGTCLFCFIFGILQEAHLKGRAVLACGTTLSTVVGAAGLAQGELELGFPE